MDSCHSGAFIARVLDLCFNRFEDSLVPFNLFASCMHDEFAWEESSLGHGLFTYCMSVKQPSLASLAARAVQPDNSLGPSLAIAGGETGCALVTCGSQNPIVYWNGTGHLEVSGKGFDLFEATGNCPSAEAILGRLRVLRDDFREILRPLRGILPKFIDGQSDEEMRRQIQKDLAFLRSTAAKIYAGRAP
jgi:hypothetical protein